MQRSPQKRKWTVRGPALRPCTEGQGVTKRERKAGAQSDFKGYEKPPTSVRWKGYDLIWVF